jgi:hypothetical protein
MMEWQPIETAPDETEVIVANQDWLSGNFHISTAWRHAESGKWWRPHSGPSLASNITPTHWMPLPAPPPTTEEQTKTMTVDEARKRANDIWLQKGGDLFLATGDRRFGECHDPEYLDARLDLARALDAAHETDGTHLRAEQSRQIAWRRSWDDMVKERQYSPWW